ncbi:MAG: hypothetical protein ACXW3J_05840 [Methylocystis sp.]
MGGVPATARALGLSEGTVKGYLKSIFQKTGATRQADLVKLVLALESPFRAPERHLLPTETLFSASPAPLDDAAALLRSLPARAVTDALRGAAR